MPVLEIDYGQPLECKTDVGFDEMTRIIGTAMEEQVAHPLDDFHRRPCTVKTHDPR